MSEVKVKLLIVDDTPANIHILLEALRDGYQIQAATNGQRGLELARTAPHPDLILLDVIMEGMDGHQVLSELQADVRTAHIPVIFISAQADDQDEARCLEMGAVDYIIKPFRLRALRARIQQHLTWRSQRRPAEPSRSPENMLLAVSKLVESRDDETGLHLERIQQYCRLLAGQLHRQGRYPDQIDSAFVERIFHASPLHDIGKLTVPEEILQKPEKLTPDEFERMKSHTVRAAQTLSEVARQDPDNEFLRLGLDIARSHHEKWDGSGYPDGLRGHKIPLAARIMAVADVYDALTSHRCYKPAYPHQQACQILRHQSGYHFDPVIIEAYFQVEAEFAQISEPSNGNS